MLFPKSRARIRQEASDWVARLGGQARAEDHADFRRWREEDPRHAQAYDRIAAIWNEAGRLSRSPAVGGVQTDARTRRPQALWFALAASLAAVVLVTALLFASRWLPNPVREQDRMILAAGVGEIREIELPDGSRLTLDSASRVEAAFTGSARTLTLREGRARFQVAHDARPFVVRAAGSEVAATGTLFDVSLIGGHMTVFLLEGTVEVRGPSDLPEPGSRAQRLKAGQKLIVRGSARAERELGTRGDASWPSRMLEFDGTRLDEAAAQANRYSKVQLKLGDERIRSLRVSGAFHAGDSAAFARSLATAFDLQVIVQQDGSLLLVDASPRPLPAA